VWADWGSPYITLQPEYEAAQLRVFGKMFLNGHIYRCAGQWGEQSAGAIKLPAATDTWSKSQVQAAQH
jgi:valyl-tRNA synthetase